MFHLNFTSPRLSSTRTRLMGVNSTLLFDSTAYSITRLQVQPITSSVTSTKSPSPRHICPLSTELKIRQLTQCPRNNSRVPVRDSIRVGWTRGRKYDRASSCRRQTTARRVAEWRAHWSSRCRSPAAERVECLLAQKSTLPRGYKRNCLPIRTTHIQ